MNWTRAALTALTGFIVAASATDAILLRHPTGGAEVRCGPFPTFPHASLLAYQKERDCIADYQRQGYERTPR